MNRTLRENAGALGAGRRPPYQQLRAPLRVVGALLDAGAVHPRRSARFSFGTNVAYTGELTVTSRRLPLTGLAVGWRAGVALGLLLVGGGLLLASGSETEQAVTPPRNSCQ
jgi:hypothetical protein